MTEKKEQNNEARDLVPIHDEIDIFKKFDEMDDQLIMAELEQKVVDVWVYHFIQEDPVTKKKKEIWGLAKEGVDQCSILMGKKGIALREEDLKFEVDPTSPEHVIFTAKVLKVLVDAQGNEAKVDSVIGTKRQSLMRKIKQKEEPGYRMVSNPFWSEQGSQKAIRNAKMRLIPADIKAKVIANAKQLKGKVKTFEQKPEPQSKKKEKPQPPQQKQETKKETQPVQTNQQPSFPDDVEQEQPEQLSLRGASQSKKNKVTGLMQTMVDKYNFHPDQVLEKMDAKAGSHDVDTYTDKEADAVIEYFEWAIAEIEKQRK